MSRAGRLYDDFYAYDPASAVVTNLSAFARGARPEPRSAAGFVGTGGGLFVFGGTTARGVALQAKGYSRVFGDSMRHND